MSRLKGDAVLSETMLNTITLVISFILIISVVYGIFFSQTERTTKSAFEAIPREIGSLIDRTAALAGSQEYEFKMLKGVNVNLSVGYKKVYLTYDKGTIEKSFSGLMHSGPYHFVNPKTLCFVKNRDDKRIMISGGGCSCNLGDGTCDPECIVNNVCDPDCYTEEIDYVCNKFCAGNGDNLCDPDCYRNEIDKVCDLDCIKENEADGVCDPDCDNIEKGVCDLDCVIMFNGTEGSKGVCDPDCKPVDKDSDGFEDEKDGYCYTGCSEEIKGGIVRLPKDGICDLDCNETNEICDPDCRLDEDCEEKCAIDGENCTDLPCCEDFVCCPGTKLCALEKDYEPACCRNGICEVSPIIKGKYPYLSDYIDTYQPCFNARYLPNLWENYYTCEEDCESKDFPHPTASEPAGWFVDGVCDRSMSFSTDPDCCEEEIITNNPDCEYVPCLFCDPEPMDVSGTPAYFDLKDEIYYCDPDAAWGASAIWGTNYPNPCPVDRTMLIIRHQAELDGICVPTGDRECDPDCVNDDTSCDPDCCAFNTPNPCPSSPGCYCPVRVNKGSNSDGGPYFTNTDITDWTKHTPHLTKNVVGVCSDAAIKFLDRRGWDIKQIEIELKSPDPLGFAFDRARYGGGEEDISKTGAYKASKTILANEKYNLTKRECNSILTSEKEICAGVGFCGDHAIAMMSILRTLGVPPYDVYAAFSSSKEANMRHAYVLYYCDSSLPNNLKLKACDGNWNKWLRVDATHHGIEVFEGTTFCEHLCIAWNDYGAYPLINSTIYGFGGLITKNSGYPFPKVGTPGVGSRGLNCNVDPTCILNTNDPNRLGMCELMKDINFECIE